MALKKDLRRNSIKKRVRKIITGTTERPRLTVYRSNKQIYAQLIDDTTGKTILAASSIEKDFQAENINKIEQAKLVGNALAQKAVSSGIKNVVFDRNGYLYHGRVKSLAESAREGGLNF